MPRKSIQREHLGLPPHTQRIRTSGNRRTVTAQQVTQRVIVAPTRVSTSQHEIINPYVKMHFTKPLTTAGFASHNGAGLRRTVPLLVAVPSAYRRLPAPTIFRVLLCLRTLLRWYLESSSIGATWRSFFWGRSTRRTFIIRILIALSTLPCGKH